jgi:hypothetical protein
MKVYELLEKIKDQYKVHSLQKPIDKSISKVDTPEKAAEIIKAQCKTFLGAYKKSNGIYLYRGITEVPMGDNQHSGDTSDIVAANIRPDRRPLYMRPEGHEMLTKAMDSLGLKANRKNSLFCTTSRKTASSWGEVYILFVKDGWTGTIFEKVKTGYVFKTASNICDAAMVNKNNNNADKIKYVADELKKLKPKSLTTESELSALLKEKYEDVLITGSSFIALKYYYSDEEFTATVFDLLGLREPR